MNLTNQLLALSDSFIQKAPKEIQDKMQEAHDELVERSVLENSLDVGDKFPHFKLKNHKDILIDRDSLFEDNKFLIVSFYRGGWCPYCNLELKALQDHIDTFKELGAELVAISPEKSDSSLSTVEKSNLKFSVLSDSNSELSVKLGINFELPKILKPIYESFEINIKRHNGNSNYSLPVPATYVINSDFEIIYSFKNIDYKKRSSPEEIIDFLRK